MSRDTFAPGTIVTRADTVGSLSRFMVVVRDPAYVVGVGEIVTAKPDAEPETYTEGVLVFRVGAPEAAQLLNSDYLRVLRSLAFDEDIEHALALSEKENFTWTEMANLAVASRRIELISLSEYISQETKRLAEVAQNRVRVDQECARRENAIRMIADRIAQQTGGEMPDDDQRALRRLTLSTLEAISVSERREDGTVRT